MWFRFKPDYGAEDWFPAESEREAQEIAAVRYKDRPGVLTTAQLPPTIYGDYPEYAEGTE